MENNTLTQMWETRPPRIPENQGGKAVIGGVCEGIGARYQLDPTFIRVVFVALSLAFGGGVFLYLLCWINMPRFGLARSPWATIITPKDQLNRVEKKERDTGWLLLLGLFFFFPLASTGDLRAVLVTIVLFAVGWYFAHRRQPEPPAELTPSSGKWHPPEQTHPAPAKMRPLWLWIPVTVVLTVITVFALGVVSEVRLGNYSRFGSSHITVEYEAALSDIKRPNGFVGDTFLDLTELEPLSEPRTITLENPIGRTDITLPDNVPVDVNCEVTIGETACPEETQNADADSALLTINVTQRVGSVSAYYAREDAGVGN
ncbi:MULTISPECIES: PspC domain-containing protein [unclassified Corynebacterium]|uniref:PspC domain-containing protein n=1 Tax=unclassified Corynebacterium TaxID=2624378 RepID=UPI001EF483AE|nr:MULTISPECIES: PspC domain-containing protein [unclassified Corynebacterium]MCG7288890.1 PspC domain-containing protein [Corynebacterium sp. ACRPZ]MCG7294788.1 PspC domain-containing protein [Corynebacterium sp. ACRPY]